MSNKTENIENPDEQEIQEEELFVHHRFEVDKGQEPLRIDKYIMNFLAFTSRNKIQQAAKAGCLKVNDKVVKSNYKVRPNDKITVLMSNPAREKEILAEDIPLDIRYEDDDLLVLMKPSGMVVHPGFGNHTGTLVNALTFHLGKGKLPDKSKEQDRPGLVHRLDKDTTGLMVVAKSDWAMTHLAKQFFDKTVHRRYVALVWGDVETEEGRIETRIGRNIRYRKLMAVIPEDEEGGKHAVTHYKVLERFGYTTLVECRLETGRTHQIRVHMKHLKHTLFNDERYGGDRILKGTVYTKYKQFVDNCFKALPRQALHAKELGFVHPTSGESLHFDSEMPEDMDKAIDKWRKYMNRS